MTTDLGTRDEFIQNNLGLVHSCAGRFRGRGIEYDDLYSAGSVSYTHLTLPTICSV